jgi:hypothetical protein
MRHNKQLIPNTALAQVVIVYLDQEKIKEFSCVGLDDINELIREANDIVGLDNWNRIEVSVKKL